MGIDDLMWDLCDLMVEDIDFMRAMTPDERAEKWQALVRNFEHTVATAKETHEEKLEFERAREQREEEEEQRMLKEEAEAEQVRERREGSMRPPSFTASSSSSQEGRNVRRRTLDREGCFRTRHEAEWDST